MNSKRMGFFANELEQLKAKIVRFTAAFFVVVLGLLTLSFGQCHYPAIQFSCLVFGAPSIATELFLSAQSLLVPSGVPVVALGPVSVFLAPLSFSFLAAFLITFPYGLFQAVLFLRPALRPNERRTVYSIAIPSLLLFYLGAALAYFLVIPKTFAILYSFAAPMGIAPMFALDDFLASTVLITVATGLAFLLPVMMVLFSRIGVVPPMFWYSHWRGAFLSTLLFSAVVTPDGSGITMVFLALPLMMLYGAGAFIARPKGS